MNPRAARLVWKLAAIQILTGAVTALVVVAFAPRLLLLDPSVVAGSMPLVVWAGAALFAYVLVATLVVTWRVRPALRALAAGSSDIEPADILALYAVPARLVTVDVIGTFAICASTLAAPLRPDTNDLYTQVELVTLAMTMVSVAALPFYVTVRASVARVIELAPVKVARDALGLLEERLVNVRRVRLRLFAAVIAPVAFVALAASLLVHAHIRAFDTQSREADAAELARGVLEPVNKSTRGRDAAVDAAKASGFAVKLARTPATFGAHHDDRGETTLVVPLDDGHALIRFDTVRLSTTTGVYALIAFGAIVLAGALGARIGGAFANDVTLATREVHATGAMDFIRGMRLPYVARFASVAALAAAIDDLGGVFREFAAAQERAIDARSATERMRGLFLASMSHDLKAPLNAILGFAELLSRARLTDGQRESVTIVEQRGRELLHLIDTILDAARAEAGELAIAPEWTRVGDVVMPAVLDARELVAGMDVQISGEIQPGMPRILVDPARVTQALTAVALVAVRFADHGIVGVRATLPAAGEKLRIDVETTGRGLPHAEREKIFDAFKYADRARRHGSLGLGPSLARSIIELHGGTIDVDTTEGGGTVFHVWLPTERTRRSSIPDLTTIPGEPPSMDD
jgi:signal transduction histidine kinase